MAKSVSVLYVLTKLELGGAQKVCLALFDGLRNSGNFAGLVSGAQGPLVEKVKNSKDVYLVNDFKREIGLKNIFNEFRSFFKMFFYIRNLRKKYPKLIVHTHSTKAGIMGRWAAFFSGTKFIIHTVHGFGFHDHQNNFSWFIIYFFELLTSLVTTKFVCVSENDRKIGEKRIPFFGRKAEIIRAAVDYDKFYIPSNKTSFDKNKFIIGTVACFKPQKNLFDLLKAFKKLSDDLGRDLSRSLCLQIVGDGILRSDIENWILQSGLKDNILLLGWQNNVAKWMKNWNVFALSSLWEGLPCAVVEARLSCLPVVCYKISGIPEVIFDNKNGFLVEAGDWQMLSEKIKILFLNKDLYQNFSCYNDRLNEFHEHTMVKNHLSLYQKII